MTLDSSHLFRHYILCIKRLRGDPRYLARGVGFSVFMGALPLVPIHTLRLIPLSAALRVSTIAALIAATLVSNLLTTGGMLIDASCLGVISYFVSLYFFRAIRRKLYSREITLILQNEVFSN